MGEKALMLAPRQGLCARTTLRNPSGLFVMLAEAARRRETRR